MGYSLQQLNQRLRRDYIMLSNIPSIVTIFNLNQQVVHQVGGTRWTRFRTLLIRCFTKTFFGQKVRVAVWL